MKTYIHKGGELPLRVKDYRGVQGGLLTVIEYDHSVGEKGRSYWRCICACGKERVMYGTSVAGGNTRSCGCLVYESVKAKRQGRKPGEAVSEYMEKMLAHPHLNDFQRREIEEAKEYREWYLRQKELESSGRPAAPDVNAIREGYLSSVDHTVDWTGEMCPSRFDGENFY